MTLGEMLAKSAKSYPDKPVIIFQSEKITYQELYKQVQALANGLKNLGINRGDKIGLLMTNSPQFVISYFAVTTLGAIVVPLNTMFKGEELTYILKDAQAKLLITMDNFSKLATELSDKVPELENIIIYGQARDFISLETLMQQEVEQEVRGEAKPKDIAVYLYTSGTTGHPKGAMLSHYNLISNVESTLEALQVGSEEAYLCVLPLFHTLAATICMLMPIYIGSRVTIQESFTPHGVLKALSEDQVSIFVGVPSIYVVLLNVDFPEGQYNLRNLRVCLCGGASLPLEVIKSFEKKYQGRARIIEGYGLSEASPVVSINPVVGQRKEGSIGLTIPKVEVKIFNEEDQELPVNQIGEIVVRGPNVMTGYYNLPEVTAEALRGGWLHTGDLGKIDEDGYIYIVDRKKDLVIVGGLNVYPREVEEVLYTHPAVAEAAVIGFVDKLRGEAVKAIVSLKPEQEVTEKELLKYCRERLATFKVPRVIEFMEALPKTSTGKILKRALK